MARTFYTVQDIQDLVAKGERALHVTDDVTLTMLARETARKLGLQLVYDSPDGEAPPYRAPVRVPRDESMRAAGLTGADAKAEAELVTTIVMRVLSQLTHLGTQAEAEMVTTIVKRVLSELR